MTILINPRQPIVIDIDITAVWNICCFLYRLQAPNQSCKLLPILQGDVVTAHSELSLSTRVKVFNVTVMIILMLVTRLGVKIRRFIVGKPNVVNR
jgi:hypothetical protein